MKALAVFTLVLAGLLPTKADTTVQTWTVTAQCDATIPFNQCVVPGVMNATMTTQLEFGNWPCPICPTGEIFDETVPAITDISGTLDGMAMKFISNGGWMYENNPQEGLPQNIFFMAGGTEYEIYYDAFFTLVDENNGVQEEMDWSAPDPPANVPEPGTLTLVASGLLGLYWLGGLDFLLRRGQTRRLNALLK